ncbi:DUF4003 family protein [Alteribacter lacisalsi]|uniref:DUF4003 family protein n=1 Tax=Alteribacter lacisalsi TaxID=2045244 RepID=UPI001374FA58|nr:DUF4003 family protein [Alteribacter lacisalsi]
MTIQDKIRLLKENDTAVKKAAAWSGLDTPGRLLIASMYANRHKAVDQQHLRTLADWIKKEVGAWSFLRTSFRYPVAANLDLFTDDPKQAFAGFLEMYDALVAAGFHRSNSTYLAAMMIVTQEKEKVHSSKDFAARAMALYKSIRSRHPFLTGEHDYPLIVLLALVREEEPDELTEELSKTYKALSDWRFSKGNDLQGLTHVLSLDNSFTHEERLEKMRTLSDAWNSNVNKMKPAYYSELGLLALRGASPDDMGTVQQTGDNIQTLPGFRWQKDLAWQIAVQFTAASDLADSPLEGHMLSTIAMLQQADTAIMLTTIGAVGVTTSSN